MLSVPSAPITRDAPGRLLDHPKLTQLSAMLKAFDAGDRIIKGRLELFSCTHRRMSQRQQMLIRERMPQSITDSPLGPLASDYAQSVLVNLTGLMSLLFVDYDCSTLSPYDFEKCPDKHTVVSTINHGLAAVVDRVHVGFLTEFWSAVQDAIDVANCDLFAFQPKSGNFEPADKSLMSFHYFFIDPGRGRILFIGCVTKSRGSVRGGVDSDSEVMLSQDSVSSRSKEPCGSSIASSLREGEYAGSENSGDDAMLD